jgi:enoyl-[acyl-carrier-protein] reductase (NADH)
MFGPPIEMFLGWKAESESITFEEAKSSLTKKMALQDMASDADVAEAIVFMASDRAKGITGQTLFVNAGEFMH